MHLAAFPALDRLSLACQNRHQHNENWTLLHPEAADTERAAWESWLGDLHAQGEQTWTELPSKPDESIKNERIQRNTWDEALSRDNCVLVLSSRLMSWQLMMTFLKNVFSWEKFGMLIPFLFSEVWGLWVSQLWLWYYLLSKVVMVGWGFLDKTFW